MTVALRPSESDKLIVGNLPRTAALVALENDDLQIFCLLLKVLGWQSVVAADFDGIGSANISLLIMNGSALKAFLDLNTDLPPGMVCGVTVDHNDQKLLEIAVRAKVTCLVRPLDIAELESLIALAS